MCATFSYQPDSQSNRDSYFIPEELLHLKGYPLYMLIAHWGVKRGAPFFRDDVARAFGLTERRAAGMMTYLHRKTDLIDSTLKRVSVGERKRTCKLRMRIKSLNDCSATLCIGN